MPFSHAGREGVCLLRDLRAKGETADFQKPGWPLETQRQALQPHCLFQLQGAGRKATDAGIGERGRTNKRRHLHPSRTAQLSRVMYDLLLPSLAWCCQGEHSPCQPWQESPQISLSVSAGLSSTSVPQPRLRQTEGQGTAPKQRSTQQGNHRHVHITSLEQGSTRHAEPF